MLTPVARDNYIKTLVSAAAFVAVTAAVYYPVASDPGNTVNGSLDDAYAVIWQLWWFKHSLIDLGANPFFTGFVESPAGVGVTCTTIVNHLLALPLTWALGPVASYNLMILLSFVLSAVAMYLLVLWITGSHPASFIAGLAYAFSPFHTAFSAAGGMDAAQTMKFSKVWPWTTQPFDNGRWADMWGEGGYETGGADMRKGGELGRQGGGP